RTDPFLVDQILINLVDNAVKYTERGSITVRASKQGRTTTIEVTDTGIGIPREHQRRIFERFYVVDKSRSRSTGGTGLGLSIARNAATILGGAIEVESMPGSGTTFRVTLPDLEPRDA
ncbi:MAG TPA: ATP-binding protein, partial [Deltaproteobacteria bacterium]|nr:ATP-binding protein [Deltaproteobacteria bacterium]